MLGTIMFCYKRLKKLKRPLANTAIFFIVLSGMADIVFSLPFRFKVLTYIGRHYQYLHPELISLHRSLSTIIGFVLLFLSYRLYKRLRMAWIIMITVIPVSLLLNILKFHSYLNIFTIIQALVLVILIIEYKEFHRASDPINLKWGVSMAAITVFSLLLVTSAGFLILKHEYRHIGNFGDAVYKSLQLLFLMDTDVMEAKSRIGMLYGDSVVIMNWTGLLAALFLVLKPLIYQPIVSSIDHGRVREFLKKWGENPISYVAIEEDKKYYFGRGVDGVIAYVVCAGVAVCAGDPICREEDIILLIGEFTGFCRQNGIDVCFCQTTEKFLYDFKRIGYNAIKYGEEAMFDLDNYSLSGGKAAKLRQAINNANRIGVTVEEYKPFDKRDRNIEMEIMEVSNEWLSIKKSSELSFMLGSISLENPMDRRYFIARDQEGRMLGFIVLVPFDGGNGYYADVTRRRKDAPIGVMEKIIVDAFTAMKSEGIKWGSLGLAPLANVRDDGADRSVVGSVLEFIYENMNRFYGFKTLHQYKKKYGPSKWETRYLVYYPGIFSPKIAYAILKAQNPKGVKDYLLAQIKLLFNKNLMSNKIPGK